MTAETHQLRHAELVSVIIPLYNEESNIEALVPHIDAIRDTIDDVDWEFVIIDDGSRDRSVELLRPHIANRSDVRLVSFTRNFGAHVAVSAGLAEATGDCVALMTADIQEPADLVAKFYRRWQEGHDTVWGVRAVRQQSRISRFVSRFFYRSLVRYSDLPSLPAEGPAGFLVSAEVAADVSRMGERHRNITAMISWVGYSQVVVEYEQLDRHSGDRKWGLRGMIESALDSFVGFSHAPIRLASMLGFGAAILGLLYAVFLIVQAIVGVDTADGWPTVVVLILVLGGIQLITVGIFGEYLWRGMDETRDRPLYLVKERVGTAGRGPAASAGARARQAAEGSSEVS